MGQKGSVVTQPAGFQKKAVEESILEAERAANQKQTTPYKTEEVVSVGRKKAGEGNTSQERVSAATTPYKTDVAESVRQKDAEIGSRSQRRHTLPGATNLCETGVVESVGQKETEKVSSSQEIPTVPVAPTEPEASVAKSIAPTKTLTKMIQPVDQQNPLVKDDLCSTPPTDAQQVLRIGAWETTSHWKDYDVMFVTDATGPAEGDWRNISNEENPTLATHVRKTVVVTVEQHHYYQLIDVEINDHRVLLINCAFSSVEIAKPYANEISSKIERWQEQSRSKAESTKSTIILCVSRNCDEILANISRDKHQCVDIEDSVVICYLETNNAFFVTDTLWKGVKVGGLRIAPWQKNTELDDYDVIFYNQPPPYESNWLKISSHDSNNVLITYIRKSEIAYDRIVRLSPEYHAFLVRKKGEKTLLINVIMNDEKTYEEVRNIIKKWKLNANIVLCHAFGKEKIEKINEGAQRNLKYQSIAPAVHLLLYTPPMQAIPAEIEYGKWNGIILKWQGAPNTKFMKVITWNLQAFEMWPVERQQTVFDKLCDPTCRPANVIILQEVHPFALECIAERFRSYLPIVGQRSRPANEQEAQKETKAIHFVTLLLRESFEPQDIQTISRHDWFLVTRAKALNGCTWLIVNFHLKKGIDVGKIRKRAIVDLTSIVKQHHGNVVAAGDTNIHEEQISEFDTKKQTAPEYTELKRYMDDVWEKLTAQQQRNYKYTYTDAFKAAAENCHKGSSRHNVGNKNGCKGTRPDRVFLLKGSYKRVSYKHISDHTKISVEMEHAESRSESKSKIIPISDHYGVIVEFEAINCRESFK